MSRILALDHGDKKIGVAISDPMKIIAKPLKIIINSNNNKVLDELKKLGVSMAIDDFGTGFSSMLYLKDMPVDTIKIDRSFVANYLTNKSDHLIVNAMIRLVKSLEKNLVLEGIETVEVLESLQAAGCESCQGFYFSKPLPYESIVEHLSLDSQKRAS